MVTLVDFRQTKNKNHFEWQHDKQHQRKELLNSFRLKGHILGFHSHSQKLEPFCVAKKKKRPSGTFCSVFEAHNIVFDSWQKRVLLQEFIWWSLSYNRPLRVSRRWLTRAPHVTTRSFHVWCTRHSHDNLALGWKNRANFLVPLKHYFKPRLGW